MPLGFNWGLIASLLHNSHPEGKLKIHDLLHQRPHRENKTTPGTSRRRETHPSRNQQAVPVYQISRKTQK